MVARLNLVYSILFSVVGGSFFIACSPEENDPDASGGSGDGPTLVTDLNGYKYEGTFYEKIEPTLYKFPYIYHIEEYQDSIQVLFTTLYKAPSADSYRWTVLSLFNGKVNRQFEAAVGTANPNLYKFAFNPVKFELLAYSIPESYVTFFVKDKKPTGFYLSKPNNNFSYKFNENYTVFFSNPATIYSYENKQQRYTAPAPNYGYVLTSESSVSWADHIFNDDAASATLFREEIITCFFNATIDKYNYIGVAKGQQTLDTLVINKYEPTLYYPISEVYASKVGNTVYLGLKKKKGLYQQDDISVYKMDLAEKIIKPVYKNIDPTNLNVVAFRAGKFYYFGKMIDSTGQFIDIPLPTIVSGAAVYQYFHGSSRLFIVIQNGSFKTELYSKPY